MASNSYTKLLRNIRRGNLHEANVLFADIMQQKSADRLAEERKSLVVEDDKKEQSHTMKCEECKKSFTLKHTGKCDEGCKYPVCPKCDGDLNESFVRDPRIVVKKRKK